MKVRSKKKKKQKTTPEDIVSKHSGILGLCAFVNAFPYDVPDFIPDILMVLSDHLHDPQPIPVSFCIMYFYRVSQIKSCSFKYAKDQNVFHRIPIYLEIVNK